MLVAVFQVERAKFDVGTHRRAHGCACPEKLKTHHIVAVGNAIDQVSIRKAGRIHS